MIQMIGVSSLASIVVWLIWAIYREEIRNTEMKEKRK
jgi:hypothetical protein